ncbi:Rieske (2Fe-2S) protein [Pseudomonas auratipiscis]|uniref:Rieske (2Fe-2S) protein n=1 Tax=Pseudomonas auratipiscis TaxID=3115853 RepID=A0AB35WXE3_9PSED|nr:MULTISPECIES: Rieske (2Fe-2S) protein [unclassified Pseudomonas]MEE1869303.1 Rieske (2Fe-2S) protein [Pseudomonas sp. 120P]MEE1959974.1 Rieske (2Fe-2S) protein [Pseudomonas sp. 119P]
MHFLCLPEQLSEGQSRGFTINGRALFAVRRTGQVYLYRNRCPHRGIALNWEPNQFLDSSGSLVACGHHGALFLIESGECVAGPCAGEHLDALDCLEDSQGIWLIE